ncbi:hypothetical protein [Deinococcus sp. SL84]|uniref:hypothetical protein n=1 Tax=Deinococcus sp. SL84 TaxID=2994663 RepID=UPI002275AA43|nr:hypothetical protein [Deinococcus sp. SL84]MCY1704391.1 hypothetical protein [Deinococcus sp. SL84]
MKQLIFVCLALFFLAACQQTATRPVQLSYVLADSCTSGNIKFEGTDLEAIPVTKSGQTEISVPATAQQLAITLTCEYGETPSQFSITQDIKLSGDSPVIHANIDRGNFGLF